MFYEVYDPHYCLQGGRVFKSKEFSNEDGGISPSLFTFASISGTRQRPLGKLFIRGSNDVSPSSLAISLVGTNGG